MRKLSDIADIIVGFPFKSALFNINGNGVRLVRGKNITHLALRWGDDTRWWNDFSVDLDKYYLKEGDILIGMDGSLVGKNYARVRTDDLPLLLVQRVACIRAKDGTDQDFLWSCISNIQFELYIDAIKTGTSIPHISGKQIAEYPIPYFSYLEQTRIGAVLRSFDDKIGLNNKINENLLEQADLLYDQIFSDEKIFTELGNVIETTSGGTPSRKHPELYENPSICWVKSKELNGGFIHTTEEMINEIALSKSAAKMLPAHCVLVAMYGATVGEYGIIASPMTCNQAVCALILNNRYPYPYLYELIRHSKEKLKNMAVGSAQQNISQVLIKQLPVHTNLDKVEQFAEATIASFQMIETLTLENIHLAFIRDTLLPKLMNGEIKLDEF